MALLENIGAGIVALSGVWIFCVALASRRFIQRHVFYLHKLPIWWGQRLDDPETFGFLRNQVTPLRIPTTDGERLYAWLVSPLALYEKHETTFQKEDRKGDIKTKLAFKLLTDDPEAHLIIYFHGNAGTVGQTRRTETYRMISSGASSKIHVLAFDYRGFGKSTGTPTEQGLIADAISVIDWARKEAGIPSTRILLLAQSLGTGLACAAADHFISLEPKVPFAGIILCAAFPSATKAFQSYSVGGFLPLLAPLRLFPSLEAWFRRRIKDTWMTDERLVNIVRRSDRLRLTFIHATSDKVIPCRMSDELFYVAANVTTTAGLTRMEVEERKEVIDLGEGGWVNKWVSGDKIIRKEIVKYGGHNGIMKWAPFSLAVLRNFELSGIEGQN
ncbi:hypothetical protein AJ80_02020 [Polytolypa hystricis UAMH7299]|uniref:AB hydrolase-1 domain-containing protein n=1 Tax=Polytolypa hystricis (strain UAMH7299) TaxID=1447883 RepID=A0A2B7YST6_POLH7|nr:hypothetical protein AJ80_02020 [Polytolypa hystricis UAMH7299]